MSHQETTVTWVTNINFCTYKFTWKLENFRSLITSQEVIHSPEFFAKGTETKMEWKKTEDTLKDTAVLLVYQSDLKKIQLSIETTIFDPSNNQVYNQSFNTLGGSSCAFAVGDKSTSDRWNKFESITIILHLKLVSEISHQKCIDSTNIITSSISQLNLENLLDDTKFSDVRLIVSGKEILAHKNILALQSPVFDAMFRTNMKENLENKVYINDFDYEIFSKVVRYMYSGNIDLTNIISEVLAIAHKYLIENLKKLCERD